MHNRQAAWRVFLHWKHSCRYSICGTPLFQGSFRPATKPLEAAVFSLENIPWADLAFKSTEEALRDYLRTGKNRKDGGLEKDEDYT